MKFLMVIFICSTYCSRVFSENSTDTSTFLLCETAKRTYRDAGYQDDDIYTIEQNEKNLKVCGQHKTCCKATAEKNLVDSSEKKRKVITNPLHGSLKETFQSSGAKFRAFFQSMLSDSQRNLDSMFQKTYSVHYRKNSYVFKDLYKSLQQYINGSELDLKVKFDTFFSNLHEKIYVMSKVWLDFDDKYKNCIRDKTHTIQPFGEKQMRISYQTTRAFEASRMFLQGLKEGMEVTLKLLDIPVHDQCKIAFMKMTQCSICSGVNLNMKPCSKYCLNVMKGCYAYIFMIQSRWTEYITSMMNLAAKLEGPFNLEALVVPLGVKISEAIMTFQENQQNITVRVEASCGKAPMKSGGNFNKRKRRNTDDKKEALDKLNVASEQEVSPGGNFQSQTQKIIDSLKAEKNELPYPTFMKTSKGRATTEFELSLSSTKKALNELKDYWMLVPSKLCKMGMASDRDENCWNGENTTGYTKDVVEKDLYSLFNKNPEMILNDQAGEAVVILQDEKLKLITAKLNSVIEGNGVNCVDCETNEGSGGDTNTVEDNQDNEIGSGKSTEGSGDEPKEGSGGDSGSGETDTTKSPPTPCHGNEVNCRVDETEDVHINHVDNDPLPWANQRDTKADSSRYDKNTGTMQFANLLLLLLCAVLAML